MSIKEIGDKIKGSLERIVFTDHLFFGVVVVLVGVASFGLGRLSASSQSDIQSGNVAAGVVLTQKVLPSAEKTVIEETVTTSQEYIAQDVATTTGMYVGSKNSDKYHLPWCSGARRITEANKVWFKSEEEAEKAGYVPAGNCPGI